MAMPGGARRRVQRHGNRPRALEITRRRGLAGKPGWTGRSVPCRPNLCLEE
ncbi:hypothetical protein AZ20_0496 [Bordetella bronchiseptica E014]|nr:hypothetical protein L576_0530 [Bordetella bronchiseptica OSU054]KAK65312.1 hypothetical protein L530_0539 [Bordetella bronchiseptica MO211]KDB77058.1 hypothetical protein L494_0515 [Bordetella bronchiseptica CA90 BB1334]KDC15454.1 hypothetical protein AZ20_0496 [Bordetella bronchiseptica E014]KDC66323.1 hypothetical protein L510_0536 [Bordetella bronchiseptica MBORD591]KDD44418.1 hypothetical protein L532_0567 [Bordetella bronchiseptica OSU095]